MDEHTERTQSNIERFASLPVQLKELLQGQAEEALSYRQQEDAWSVTETLGHLMVFGARWGNRIQQMLAAEDPKFVFVDPEEPVQRFDFASHDPNTLLENFSERRAEHAAFLRTLDPLHLARTGIEPDGHQLSVDDAIELLVTNDGERLGQIVATLDAYTRTRSR